MALNAIVNVNAAGTQEIIPAVPNKSIQVLAYTLVAAGSVSVTFQHASVAFTGPMPLSTNQPLVVGYMEDGYFIGAKGENLSLLLGAGVEVAGHVAYSLIDKS